MIAFTLTGCPGRKNVDDDISWRNVILSRLLATAESGQVYYGHQDDPVYGHSWKVTDIKGDSLTRSDVRDVAGKYPYVVGFDLGGIELGDSCNLDGVPFDLMRKAAMKHIARGGIVTFSWHPRNPLTGGDAWDISSSEVVSAILEGGPLHEEFIKWLDRAAAFLGNLGGAPVIFRPWHENLGSWFWWGGKLCTADQYKDLYRLTWNRLAMEKGLHQLIWCYSPNGPVSAEDYLSRYPGDDVVDILGTDIYEYVGDPSTSSGTVESLLEEAGERYVSNVREMLSILQDISKERLKLMCLSETGLEGLVDPVWWTGRLLPAIEGFPVSYVLTWRNAHDKPGHFYAPWKGFANEEDFKLFSEKKDIVLL